MSIFSSSSIPMGWGIDKHLLLSIARAKGAIFICLFYWWEFHSMTVFFINSAPLDIIITGPKSGSSECRDVLANSSIIALLIHHAAVQIKTAEPDAALHPQISGYLYKILLAAYIAIISPEQTIYISWLTFTHRMAKPAQTTSPRHHKTHIQSCICFITA